MELLPDAKLLVRKLFKTLLNTELAAEYYRNELLEKNVQEKYFK
jgi:hypothetical protein